MHVNTAFSEEGQNVNCALCTAAALTDQSSGDVNAELQLACPPTSRWGPFESDQAFVVYTTQGPGRTRRVTLQDNAIQPIADQMIGIATYVAQKYGNGTQVKFFGNPAHRSRGSDVIPAMLRQPDGTKFAVFTSDGSSLYGDEAHWIFAQKQNNTIEYLDFQTDKQLVRNASPSRANNPMRPGGRAYTSADNTYMIAIAFGTNLAN
ncbi:MAG: hypothetical protein OEZ43_05460 [Gammaproteobacteria bacterium]|nr:hypothetical protein [Gammaproteobacteria bacterium]